MMKFDVIGFNAPYQLKVGDRKTQPLWDKFVVKSFEYLNTNGYSVQIHPGTWRNAKGQYHHIQDLYKKYDVQFLSLNDFNDGQKMFSVGTNYDCVVVQKKSGINKMTTIIDVNDEKHLLDINKMEFIPNAKFKDFNRLIAKKESEKINVLFDRSTYGNDKNHMSEEKTGVFKYPCVYTITQKNGVKFLFSSQKNGHFGIPKVIWSNGLGSYPIIDNGKYGVTNFSAAIVDKKENLKNIKNALESKKFLELMELIKFKNDIYDYRVISTFKKDFWKYFVDKNGNEI